MPVPESLISLGSVLDGAEAAALTSSGHHLRAGRSWVQAWEGAWDDPLRDLLAPAWHEGVEPSAMLRHHMDELRRTRIVEARKQAAILGVKLVLPLGLCLLPAFILWGLVPAMLGGGIAG